MASRARHRLGVVLLVPPPVDREVDGLRRALGDGSLGRVRPHLTLVPPVNVRADRLEDALAAVRDAAASAGPIDVVIGPPATFLPVNPVLYLAVGGRGLAAVHALRDAVFVPPLEREQPWPFVPHVTIADGLDPERIAAGMAALASYEAGIRFERVHVLEQGDDLGWRPVLGVDLAGRAMVGRGGLELVVEVGDRLDPAAAAWVRHEWAAHHAGEGSDGPADLVAIARRDGRIVGTATGWVRGLLANLSELVVGADVRREGVGSHLLAAFLSEAAERGALLCRLRTDEGSTAEVFYRARGWTEEARYPGPTATTAIVQLVRHLA